VSPRVQSAPAGWTTRTAIRGLGGGSPGGAGGGGAGGAAGQQVTEEDVWEPRRRRAARCLAIGKCGSVRDPVGGREGDRAYDEDARGPWAGLIAARIGRATVVKGSRGLRACVRACPRACPHSPWAFTAPSPQ
jgi:hypothetical protein